MMAIKWRENQQRDLNKERIQKIFRGKKTLAGKPAPSEAEKAFCCSP
jgi:hypothetical protein